MQRQVMVASVRGGHLAIVLMDRQDTLAHATYDDMQLSLVFEWVRRLSSPPRRDDGPMGRASRTETKVERHLTVLHLQSRLTQLRPRSTIAQTGNGQQVEDWGRLQGAHER